MTTIKEMRRKTSRVKTAELEPLGIQTPQKQVTIEGPYSARLDPSPAATSNLSPQGGCEFLNVLMCHSVPQPKALAVSFLDLLIFQNNDGWKSGLFGRRTEILGFRWAIEFS
jgi:hypothetical protein